MTHQGEHTRDLKSVLGHDHTLIFPVDSTLVEVTQKSELIQEEVHV